MAGNSPNNDAQRQRTFAVERWMLLNVKEHGYERYDDLHIDQIDPSWRPRERWIEGGIQAFKTAVYLRNRFAIGFSVVLAYSLRTNDQFRGIDFHGLEDLAARVDSSPPSVYLFVEGKEPWTESGIRDGETVADNIFLKTLDLNLIGPVAEAKYCCYMEFRQPKMVEWSRSVFVQG